mgnify:CR=1 FL=1
MIDLLGERLIITICLHHLRLYLQKSLLILRFRLLLPITSGTNRPLIEIREFQRNSDTCRHSGKRRCRGFLIINPGVTAYGDRQIHIRIPLPASYFQALAATSLFFKAATKSVRPSLAAVIKSARIKSEAPYVTQPLGEIKYPY